MLVRTCTTVLYFHIQRQYFIFTSGDKDIFCAEFTWEPIIFAVDFIGIENVNVYMGYSSLQNQFVSALSILGCLFDNI